eukprot:CAMPEP_0117656006 /NCGR_PEP_ID=MMETSP0804-20121206/4576_1 /TAXON_ID=1074897 /ORGANISM="Tetraselmis astigmatica, Strain CCMP880" /LENGTH=120 /DNA_ID=CAMNT_0005462383 /DNA_START=152 /DNA_END=515 /DNA_ORIENTATION=+
MAAKILANIIIAGAGVLLALGHRRIGKLSSKAGMNAETIRHAAGKYKMSTSEARKILEVESTATLGEIRQKYEHLFEVNEKHGTFYLQSKIYRAMERLEAEAKDTGEAAHDSKQSTEGEK